MAATKSASTLLASTTCAASGTQTSAALNLTTAYGAIITCQITNGSTAPSAACAATLNLSPDGSTWYFWASQTAGTTASGVYPLAFEVPPSAMYCQIVCGGNTGSAVTVAVQAEVLTGL